MTDRELLELAAKAAGVDARRLPHAWPDRFDDDQWDPLIDDSDAFRLAVDLGLVADFSRPSAGKPYKQHAIWLDETMSNAELARRAIVCAAAEVGRKMK